MTEASASSPHPQFGSGLRGYDRAEVDAYLEEISGRIARLEEERDGLAARVAVLGDQGSVEVQTEIQVVGAEVDRILRAAYEAAEGMRARASTDAARWRAEAEAEATRVRAEAEEAAQHARGDAWVTATELIDQAVDFRTQILNEAEQDSLTVRARAEQDAHRHVGAARRDMEDEARQARLESERIVARASSEAETLVEAARREAEAAQERARALEQRRAELMGELDAAQQAISQLESQLETRRASLQSVGTHSSSVKVIGGEAPENDDYFDEEKKVRVVGPVMEHEAVDADLLAAEVRRMRESRIARPAPPARRTVPEVTPEPEPLPEPEPVTEPEPVPVAAAEDDIHALFESLRRADGGANAESNGSAAAEVRPAVAVAVAEFGIDPFDLRDRLLLPITNRVLRNLKKSIVELQNLVLEEIRTGGAAFVAGRSEFEQAMGEELRSLAGAALAAGGSAAAELVEADSVPRPDVEPADPTEEVAGALFDGINDAVERARLASGGDREVAAAVTRVFRAWRTDAAERWLRAAAFASYHEGVLWGLAELDTPMVRGVLAGAGCAECPARLGQPWEPGGVLPEGAGIPPVHVDCACTLVPAS